MKNKIDIEFEKIIRAYQKFIDYVTENSDITAFAGNDFACYLNTREIEIPMLLTERGVNQFMVSLAVANVGNIDVYDFDILVWSLLHEIGHLSTKQGDIISKIGRKLSRILEDKGLTKLSAKIYYNLPEEKNATEWATDYVNTHYKEMKQWEKFMLDNYVNFYETLDIEI